MIENNQIDSQMIKEGDVIKREVRTHNVSTK